MPQKVEQIIELKCILELGYRDFDMELVLRQWEFKDVKSPSSVSAGYISLCGLIDLLESRMYSC